MTPRELLGWLDDNVDTSDAFSMAGGLGYVRRALEEMTGPEPRTLDPETAERVRKLRERRDALADKLYHRLMDEPEEPASEPSSVSPGRLRARCAELERERDAAQVRAFVLGLRVDALRAGIDELRQHGPASTSLRAQQLLEADTAHAAKQNTSGRHEPGAVPS